MNTMARCLRVWVLPQLAVTLLLSFRVTASAVGQRIYLRSERTICSTPFRPVGGYTFHAGGKWSVTWNTQRGQFGNAVYLGYPNPVKSADGQKIWDNPTAWVECWINWYLESGGEQAYYDWHIVEYGGDVRDCVGSNTGGSGGPNGIPDEYDPYEPYDPWGCSDASSGGGGGDNDGGAGGCRVEYVYVEVSYDGGNTWHTIWEGFANVC